MAVLENFSDGARDVLHVGIGLYQTVAENMGQLQMNLVEDYQKLVDQGVYRTVAESMEELQNNIVAGYEDLVKRGASENGETAAKLRDSLDRGLTTVKEVQARIEAALKLKPGE